MKKFGLIGYPLSHSFSKKYFTEKFNKENIKDCEYELYELAEIEKLAYLLDDLGEDLVGLNVTIPYKEDVIVFMDDLDPAADEIGAVNVVKQLSDGTLKGYNSDYLGFKITLQKFIAGTNDLQALVLGTGGASKAVVRALKDLSIPYKIVSRTAKGSVISYDDIPSIIGDYKLIINTTPVGMHPKVDLCPHLPYSEIGKGYFLYDLVYNPEETLFMKKGRENGALAIHGMDMLIAQAEEAWRIWNKKE